jgi:hypothetical protein
MSALLSTSSLISASNSACLDGEVAVEGAARHADGAHQRIDARGFEAAALRDGSAAGEQLLSDFLFVGGGVTHGRPRGNPC